MAWSLLVLIKSFFPGKIFSRSLISLGMTICPWFELVTTDMTIFLLSVQLIISKIEKLGVKGLRFIIHLVECQQGWRWSGLIASKGVAGVTYLASSLLGLEQQAGDAWASFHCARWQFFGFEFHGAASMRKMLIPRDVIVLAPMTVDILTHSVHFGFWPPARTAYAPEGLRIAEWRKFVIFYFFENIKARFFNGLNWYENPKSQIRKIFWFLIPSCPVRESGSLLERVVCGYE